VFNVGVVKTVRKWKNGSPKWMGVSQAGT